ncbi:recombinase family protein [Aneurinibacillus tyrosinisolvens]|uniref:recombinase family protein n=1 Tax=Aneurinibacillus tyrosinisolvens TaxID=1443435 RepID=UPI00063F7606|nr:recombinase family protein [Aneurinibacillus tyrosinisolvens]
MSTKKRSKAVGYVRVSSESQIENTSIEEQKRKITSFCDIKDFELLKIFSDEGKSGGDINRPGYQSMLSYLNENQDEIESVIVLKMDRAHRNQLNLLNFITVELEQMKIDFISITESFDTSKPVGRLMLGILSTFAQFEKDIINERTRNGRVAKAKSNRRAGGAIPYGYQENKGEITINPEEAGIIKEIFQGYAEGDTLYRIAKILNKRGVPTKHGDGKNWTHAQVRYILQNETYTGVNTYDGKKEQNQIVQKDIFPKIISKQLWNKVRASESLRKEKI